MIKKTVNVEQYDGNDETVYFVTKTVNTTNPKVREQLEESDVRKLIQKNITVNIINGNIRK